MWFDFPKKRPQLQLSSQNLQGSNLAANWLLLCRLADHQVDNPYLRLLQVYTEQ